MHMNDAFTSGLMWDKMNSETASHAPFPPYAFSHHNNDHSRAYTFVNTAILYPSSASHSHRIGHSHPYTTDTKTTGLRAVTGRDRDLGLRMDFPELSKSVSPSLSVRTFVTAVEVIDCEKDMSAAEGDKPDGETVDEGLLETERLVKDISLDGDQKAAKSKGERREGRRRCSRAHGSKTSSKRSSRNGSRRNSDAQPTTALRGSSYGQLPPNVPQRTSSRIISPARRATLVNFHHNSKDLFQSLGAALEDPKEAPSAISALLKERTSVSSKKEKGNRNRSYSTLGAQPGDGNGGSPLLPQSPFSDDVADEETTSESRPYKPVPATVIDWTQPNTRRREYEKIDRSHSGVRGMWKKVAPRFCQGKCARTPFYTGDEKDDDTRSVRRYRIEDDNDGDDSEVKKERKWNCFGLGRKE